MISRYTRPPFKELWSDSKRFDTWLQVELAACKAMEQAPQTPIPKGTAADLTQAAKQMGPWDLIRLQELENQTQHDVVAFLQYLEEKLGPQARFLHWGMTSSDVLDTSFSLLLKEAGSLILQGLRTRLLPALRKKAETYQHIPCIGRSHGIHAEPITMGLIFLSFYAEQERAAHRLEQAILQISTGKISGVVGVYGSGCLSPEVEKEALHQLGLFPEPISTQIIPRDRYAEFFFSLTLIGAAIERIATTIRHLQRTEVAEVEEAFSQKQTGSSAMPHKKNPVLSENLCGLSRLLRAQASASLENIPLWHERDISHSSVERIIAPDMTSLADFMVQRATTLVDGLKIKSDQIEKNLNITNGLYCSEKVLLALIEKGLTRQKAYEIVQKNALAAQPGSEQIFQEKLTQDSDIQKYLTIQELESCFQLQKHLRHVDQIFTRVLETSS